MTFISSQIYFFKDPLFSNKSAKFCCLLANVLIFMKHIKRFSSLEDKGLYTSLSNIVNLKLGKVSIKLNHVALITMQQNSKVSNNNNCVNFLWLAYNTVTKPLKN